MRADAAARELDATEAIEAGMQEQVVHFIERGSPFQHASDIQ